MRAGSAQLPNNCKAEARHNEHEWFSDKIYWQVADQPGKEGPGYLVMVDLVDKEEKKRLSSLNQKELRQTNVPRADGMKYQSRALLVINQNDVVRHQTSIEPWTSRHSRRTDFKAEAA